MTPDPADAQYCLLTLYAEDAYKAPGAVQGMGGYDDPRLAPAWRVRGHITGLDAIFRGGPVELGATRCFYGWLLERADGSEFAVAIRGTESFVEWLEDAEFAQCAYAHGGKVEAGFYGIYESMLAVPLGGAETALIPWLISQIGDKPVGVMGHSLGGPLATYLAADLARAGAKVKGRFFESPHPGDREFAEAFAAVVPDHVAYRYGPDIVPRVPLWFSYCQLPNVVTIEPDQAPIKVRMSVTCNHHAFVVACLIDPACASAASSLDAQAVACIVR